MTISPPRSNRSGWIGLAIALVVIGAATLVPAHGEPKPQMSIVCLVCDDFGGPDILLNILLFLPLGVFLGRVGLRPLHALALGAALSVGIEAIQVLLPGRSTTVRDVLCNAVGCWVGAVIVARLADWLAPSRGAALRLVAAVAAAIAIVGATGALAQISPSRTPYYAHWSPQQEHLERWTGRLTLAELDGIARPEGLVPDADAVRDGMRDGVEIRLEGVGGAPTTDLGGIFTISDAEMHEVLLVGPSGTDLVVRLRRRTADIQLDAWEPRFKGLLAGIGPGEPFVIRIRASASGTCASVNGLERCEGAPGAGSAWNLVREMSDLPLAAQNLLSAFTLAALVFPVGLFLRSVRPPAGAVAVLALVAGAVLAAYGTGLAFPVLVEWLGLAAGLVAGLAVNRLVLNAGTRSAHGRAA